MLIVAERYCDIITIRYLQEKWYQPIDSRQFYGQRKKIYMIFLLFRPRCNSVEKLKQFLPKGEFWLVNNMNSIFFSINLIVTFWLTFPRGYWITLTFVIWLHYFWIRFVACCSTGIQGVMSICFNRIGKKQKNDVQLSSSWPCLHFMTRLFVNRIEHFLEQVGSLTLLSFWNNMQVIRK